MISEDMPSLEEICEPLEPIESIYIKTEEFNKTEDKNVSACIFCNMIPFEPRKNTIFNMICNHCYLFQYRIKCNEFLIKKCGSCDICLNTLYKGIKQFKHFCIKMKALSHTSRMPDDITNLNDGDLVLKQEGPYECDLCKKTFARFHSMKRHIAAHLRKKLYRCKFCCKIFKQSSHLKRHLNSHENKIRRYKCEPCGKLFVEGGSLKAHLNEHENRKHFPCNLCKKSFVWRTSLKVHLASHENSRKYKCDLCEKSFNVNTYLKQHMKIHAKMRLYRCDLCNKCFKTPSILLNHQNNMHKYKGNFQCEFCSKTYGRFSSLHKHLTTHTNSTKYKCRVCDKLFKTQSILKQHMSKHSDTEFECKL